MMALRMTVERRRPLKQLLMSLHLLFITLYVFKGGKKIKEKLLIV